MDVINMLLKWWWIVAIAAVLTAIGMYVHAAFFQTPIYESKGSIYVSSRTSETDTLTLAMQEANARLGETYIELAQSESALSRVSYELQNKGYGYISVKQLRAMISYTVLNETEVLDVRALNADPALAQAVTNAALTVIPSEIKKIVQVGRIEVIDMGNMPGVPVSPNVLKQTLLGLIIGFALGAGIVLLLELLDVRIKPDNNLEQMYGIPVLGNIPKIESC